jgi:ferritin
MARRALEIFDIIGEKGMGLWYIDIELGKLHGLDPANTETSAR